MMGEFMMDKSTADESTADEAPTANRHSKTTPPIAGRRIPHQASRTFLAPPSRMAWAFSLVRKTPVDSQT